MIEAQPSKTALRVALRRAAHQLHDAKPLVLEDPLAVRILPEDARAEVARVPDAVRKPYSAGIRAFMVARSRVAEDALAASGAKQYLLLGAGLDTFAYRNPHADVQVFEVDHPATQAWKLECLEAAGIAVPANASLVSVDFEREDLAGQLQAAGFRFGEKTVVAWLGVVPYLSREGFSATMNVLGRLPAGSELVMDYSYPREVLPEREQRMLDSMSARVAQAGEPFQLFFTENGIRDELARAGYALRENLGSTDLNTRFFTGRADALCLRGTGGHIACAVQNG